ncbi:hypothetical protein [Streptomyces sp. NPDC001604]|uniref:hypothetical protein n=1 Tax=Streptomyces sp. NPDC001604 TaxID=3364593 RepID=UPI00367551EF
MATNDITEDEAFGPVGYLANALAHLRAGHPIAELDVPLVLYVAPTQADVDNARHMATHLERIAQLEVSPEPTARRAWPGAGSERA